MQLEPAETPVADLVPRYDPLLVLTSVALAGLAAYVALDLAQRVRNEESRVAMAWGLAGSLVFGTGIWAMHFVGMLSFHLPIALGYDFARTALSWVVGVAASGAALALARHGTTTFARLGSGALLLGGGIAGMHYIGMSALITAPGIVWQPGWVLASVVLAVLASAVALRLFDRVRPGGRSQLGAALFMGVAVSGMHYLGMAAASFPAGTVCLSVDGLRDEHLVEIVTVATLAVLGMTLATSTLDNRLRAHSERLAERLRATNAQLRTANAELRELAFRDPLTGLPNRLLFDERLQAAAQRVERQGGRMAVLFVDLDGFRTVNDSLGHARGDDVLREAARRLATRMQAGDVLARVGGDEFVLMVEQAAGAAELGALAEGLVARLSEPLQLGERRFSISASIGIAMHPDGSAPERLLANADAAKNAAKAAGGGRWTLYAPHMQADSLEQLHLQEDLRHAADRGELSLHYQPKIDARSGAMAGMEALLRWNHPKRGFVSPAVFIPVAERFGLISALGDWVVEEACRQMAEWARQGQHIRVAVNVSVHQLRQGGLAGRIQAALARHGVDPADLLCEITESAAMEDIRSSLAVFQELLGAGVYLSIDDFGTGYSSLSYLRRMPARQLKIDRSFVNDLESSVDARAVVHAVLSVAHALGLRVVAEGVETAAQRDILGELGCDELQGYLFARPLAAGQVLDWVTARHTARPAEPALAA